MSNYAHPAGSDAIPATLAVKNTGPHQHGKDA